jgi:hypothetical protein
MPNVAHIRKSALRQPGFYFPDTQVYPQVIDEARSRIHVAIIGYSPYNARGDTSIDMDYVKDRTRRCMEVLFQAILHYDELFRSVRGG